MLTPNPAFRISAEDALAHKYFNDDSQSMMSIDEVS
jgi:hypothetical protein